MTKPFDVSDCIALITSRLGTSRSSCLGVLKSFFATRTPSNVAEKISKKPSYWLSCINRTLKEVLIDDAPVLLANYHCEGLLGIGSLRPGRVQGSQKLTLCLVQ